MVEESTTEKIYDEPFHPYTQYLINSLPKFGDNLSGERARKSAFLSNLQVAAPSTPVSSHHGHLHNTDTRVYQLGSRHKVACWLAGDGEYGQAA